MPHQATFTCDVEDYYHVSAFEHLIPRAQWGQYPSRVVENTHRILEILAPHNMRGTFFTLGIVAKQYPQLIRDIAHAGHEVASHGWDHSRITAQTPEQFRQDVRQSRAILQDLSGQAVLGYRAPSFSMTEKTTFAHTILAEEGYTYSSSVYPAQHDHYGMPNAPRKPYKPIDNLIEYPMTVLNVMGKEFPSGGGFFRLLPSSIFQRAWRNHGHNTVFYIHPWEVDPAQPKINGANRFKQWRHRVGLARTAAKLHQLLPMCQWQTMHELVMQEVTV